MVLSKWILSVFIGLFNLVALPLADKEELSPLKRSGALRLRLSSAISSHPEAITALALTPLPQTRKLYTFYVSFFLLCNVTVAHPYGKITTTENLPSASPFLQILTPL